LLTVEHLHPSELVRRQAHRLARQAQLVPEYDDVGVAAVGAAAKPGRTRGRSSGSDMRPSADGVGTVTRTEVLSRAPPAAVKPRWRFAGAEGRGCSRARWKPSSSPPDCGRRRNGSARSGRSPGVAWRVTATAPRGRAS